jgi:predicted nucleic acid-binding Zn ribbon protein
MAGTPRRSGSGADGRDPALVGEQLDRLLADRGWKGDVALGSVVGRWDDIVGPDIAAHVRPVTFQSPTLTVQADSSAWATQLRFMTSALLGRLSDVAGPGVVTELVILGPAAPSWVKGRRRVPGPGPRDTYG